MAVSDADSLDEDAAITVDVVFNDDLGADGAAVDGALISASLTGGNVTGLVTFNQATGEVTFTPGADQFGSAEITYTIEDADGDQSTSTLVLTVNPVDDPSSLTGDTGQVDERVLPAGTGVPVGGTDTTSGSFEFTTPDDFKSLTVGGTVFNSLAEIDTAITNGTVINTEHGELVLTFKSEVSGTFTISYTYTLTSAEDHATDSGGFTDPGFDNIALVVEDVFDAAPATGSIAITITDDGPVIIEIVDVVLSNEAGLCADGVLNVDFGADVNGISFAALHQNPSGQTVGGIDVFYWVDPLDSSLLIAFTNDDGSIDGDGKPTYDAAFDTEVFRLDADDVAGTYMFCLVVPLDANTTPIQIPLTGLSAGAPVPSISLAISSSGVTATFIGDADDSDGLGFGDLINSSTQGMGVGNAQVEDGETIRVDFTETAVPANATTLTAVSFQIQKLGTAETIRWTVFAADGTTLVGTGTFSGGLGENSTVTLDLEVGVDGISAEFSAVELSLETTGGDFRLTEMTVTLGEVSESIDLTFNFDAVDTDGSTASGSLNITLAGEVLGVSTLLGDAFDEVLLGGTGADVIIGGGGDDILIGGAGDDTLTGDADTPLDGSLGADTFEYQAGDIGLDTIVDFVLGTDSIDLDALITGLGGSTALSDIHFGVTVGGDTIITVDADGDTIIDAGFSITLEGVSLSQLEIESIFAGYTVVDDGVI